MQHERLFALAFDRIDHLRVTTCAQRRYDDGLCLATCEYCRTVCPGQRADFNVDRTNCAHVTTIDTRLAFDHALSNNALLKLVQLALHVFSGPLCVIATSQRINGGRLGSANGFLTILLVSDLVGIRQAIGCSASNGSYEVFVNFRCGPIPGRLANLGCQLVDRVDRDLHLLVTEHNSAEHDLLREARSF